MAWKSRWRPPKHVPVPQHRPVMHRHPVRVCFSAPPATLEAADDVVHTSGPARPGVPALRLFQTSVRSSFLCLSNLNGIRRERPHDPHVLCETRTNVTSRNSFPFGVPWPKIFAPSFSERWTTKLGAVGCSWSKTLECIIVTESYACWLHGRTAFRRRPLSPTFSRIYCRLEAELGQIERQLYDLEQHYLEDTWETGNIVRGWTLVTG